MAQLDLSVKQIIALYESGNLKDDQFKSSLNSFSKDNLVDYLVEVSSSSDNDINSEDSSLEVDSF